MIRRTFALLFVLTVAARAAGQEVDAQKVRDLVYLPDVSWSLGLHCTFDDGFSLTGGGAEEKKQDAAGEIAALEKALCGDVGDAQRYCRLSWLYADKDKAKQAARTAVELALKQHLGQPSDPRLMSRLADALFAADEKAQAEKFYWQAVDVDPQNADCWLDLASYLFNESAAVLGTNLNLKDGSYDVNRLKARQSKEVLAGSAKLLKQASACYDSAIAAAPQYARAYQKRAVYRAMVTLLEGESPRNSNELLLQLTSPEIADDLGKAADFSPRDPRLQTIAAVFELISGVKEAALAAKNKEAFAKALLARTGKRTGEMAQPLEGLFADADPKIAAEACFGRAVLQTMESAVTCAGASMDKDSPTSKKMEKWLRQAVALDPRHEWAWILLCAVTQDEQVARAHLRVKDNAYNRYIAALACFESSKLEGSKLAEAEQHLRAGLRSEPKDVSCRLGLAALLMKRGDERGLTEAGKLLAQTGSLLEKSEKRLKIDFVVLWAFHAALMGRADSAQMMLREVLKKDGGHETAARLLKVLEK